MKLKAQIGLVLFNGIIYSLQKSIKQKSLTVTKRHKKNLVKLRKGKRLTFGENIKYIRHTVQFLVIPTFIQGGGSVVIWIR